MYQIKILVHIPKGKARELYWIKIQEDFQNSKKLNLDKVIDNKKK